MKPKKKEHHVFCSKILKLRIGKFCTQIATTRDTLRIFHISRKFASFQIKYYGVFKKKKNLPVTFFNVEAQEATTVRSICATCE